jgi:hypothetical protein
MRAGLKLGMELHCLAEKGQLRGLGRCRHALVQRV